MRPLSAVLTDRFGPIRLLRSLDQLTFAQFFAPPGIADLRMAACEISSPRARRWTMSAVPRDRSLRTAFSERVNVASWPTAVIHQVRRKRQLESWAQSSSGNLQAWLRTHTSGPKRPYTDWHLAVVQWEVILSDRSGRRGEIGMRLAIRCIERRAASESRYDAICPVGRATVR